MATLTFSGQSIQLDGGASQAGTEGHTGTGGQAGIEGHTGTGGQAGGREKSKISFAKPSLRNNDHFEPITQLADPEARFFASHYRNAHKHQTDLQNEWNKLSKHFGENTSIKQLANSHETYYGKAGKSVKELAAINKSIRKKNKELKREKHLGEVVALPFRGPSLQKLKLTSESGESDGVWDEESSEKHWDLICNVLNEDQQDRIADSWSLAAALILHHNALLDKPDVYNTAMQKGIESSLQKLDDVVQKLFTNNTAFEEEKIKEVWKKYTNLARIKIPEDRPQKVFNCNLKPIEEDAEDTDAESDNDTDTEDEDEDGGQGIQPDPTPEPPRQVQHLREQLGGWNGPLSQYLQAKILAQPPRDRYIELLAQTDKEIGKLDPNAMDVDSNEDAFTKTKYFVDYNIKSKLEFMRSCTEKLWKSTVFEKLMNKDMKATREEQKKFQEVVVQIKDSIAEKKWPSNFVDAIVPPQNMLVQKRMQKIRGELLPASETGSQGSVE
jgi:hypothetical protein